MKVRELIDALGRCDPDGEIVIPVKVPGTTIGGQPVVNVNAGFDWDRGKIFLRPAAELYPVGDEFQDAKKIIRRYEERVGWALHALGANIPDAQRVKNAKASLLK